MDLGSGSWGLRAASCGMGAWVYGLMGDLRIVQRFLLLPFSN